MGYIKHLTIIGLKKFKRLDIDFNKNMNILVGENEAGKSTVLEAINIVLNQQYKNADKSVIKELLNKENEETFFKEKTLDSLPKIQIEMVLAMTDNEKGLHEFWGENRLSEPIVDYGILYECKFDDECANILAQEIREGKIPYEYYIMTWNTFRGTPYKNIKKPFKSIFIDTSLKDTNSSFNYFNRALFSSLYDENVKMNAKNLFRFHFNNAFEKLQLADIDDKRKFGINDKKVVLESIISVFENNIPLESKGSGMESLIKTQIALEKKYNIDVILMEEPENHLCLTNMNKMLDEITSKMDSSQIILTTHSSMIASRLDLRNILWLHNYMAESLASVDEKVAKFFIKADNNNFLQFLLAQKVILVEGATEYLLLPDMFQRITKHSLENSKVMIISCNGISYDNYLQIAQKTDKKVAVITDNDTSQIKIDKMEEFNVNNVNQHVFMDNDIDNWTWETCIYKLNKDYFENEIHVESNAKYLFHGKDFGKVLGKMLNNKVETAYQVLSKGYELKIPKYVEDAIKWISG